MWVAPGYPDDSLPWRKIGPDIETGGARMPEYQPALDATQLAIVRTWTVGARCAECDRIGHIAGSRRSAIMAAA